ncbi:MAG: hypothetical protein J0I40_07385 [Cellulomonas sp.]|uniref:hypothetical protein n=1 Tax=Cellulomonas sp. 73-92 TaxID=1895740 RepID=UPI00092B7EDA|nr:hypothetical protein [Cellulomonas sp. 73-92]MBN9375199.1 hypothetical protein [Cellulomonas sp.]OJV76508.1 MAG: hypothetical protein BGO37_10650 [Cellulomonas sp. 73-92]
MATSSSPQALVLGFDIKEDLRGFFADLKQVNPRMATAVRRKMRRSGDVAIAAMTEILDEYKGGVTVGKTYHAGTDAAGRKRHHLVLDTVNREAARSRLDGRARRDIESGLKFRVQANQYRTTVRLTSSKGELRKALNRKHSWRHPVFGDREVWIEQPADNYFSRGAWGTASQLRKDLMDAIAEGLALIEAKRYEGA